MHFTILTDKQYAIASNSGKDSTQIETKLEILAHEYGHADTFQNEIITYIRQMINSMSFITKSCENI
jgi:hypothetical protein